MTPTAAGSPLPARAQLPDPDGEIVPRPGTGPTVRREGSRLGLAGEAERCSRPPRGDVPELDGSAQAGGRQELAIRSEGHRLDRGGVGGQAPMLLARGNVPELDLASPVEF